MKNARTNRNIFCRKKELVEKPFRGENRPSPDRQGAGSMAEPVADARGSEVQSNKFV
jgi:hypothetical protein